MVGRGRLAIHEFYRSLLYFARDDVPREEGLRIHRRRCTSRCGGAIKVGAAVVLPIVRRIESSISASFLKRIGSYFNPTIAPALVINGHEWRRKREVRESAR